ncbi:MULTISPECIES: S8 family peptidase [Bradyrhizobium]|jgi:subtilisin|uniref:Subtilisin family serine protease n=1 Tax=Bradyrhizobium elkanii TaxID=29448 RepID=A0A8I2C5P9_BRAEL|nr:MULTISPECIES: S8 family serine peptidase [Bradyrhizobium]MBP1293556.1 subtilisin family serine protease [Bradyrhizobium elkanii]MCP1925859.1 subtilisin family serine protease [Bradyrhizobium elkanii]MCS3476649.1 subtilisin family serine protease [Bradyrhizobium elkanii]MCS3566480.1 subtilisin family serine protease [Bradyrhizobium elkanii]MCS3583387.1 subtilisin family serine protease [Bradyrhizobium elkanii]
MSTLIASMTLEAHATVIAVLSQAPPRPDGGDSLLSTDDHSSAIDQVESLFIHSKLDLGGFSTLAITRHTFNKAHDRGDFETATPRSSALAAVGPKHFPRLGLIVGDVDDNGLRKLRKDPEVDDVVHAAAPRMVYDVQLLEDATARRPWSLEFLRIPELWAKGFTDKGITIGHLDSGIDGKHPALRSALRQFVAIDGTGTANEEVAASDDHGHGTHTAGIRCARPIDGTSVGIALEAVLFSGQITGDQSLLRMLGGLEWLMGKGVRLLSLSAGVEPFNPVFQAVVERLRAANVWPIISIGNDFEGNSFSPANYADVLGVGSINEQHVVAESSCSEALPGPPPYPKPDLVAPGAGILSTRRFGGYELRSGTSRLGVMHISASSEFLKTLLEDERVSAASRADF